MKLKSFFVLAVLPTILLLLTTFTGCQAIAQLSSSSSGISNSEGSEQNTNQQIPLSPDFNGNWVGAIATYPTNVSTSMLLSEACVDCDTVPQCGPNQILIQRTCTECAYCTDKSPTNILDIVTSFLGNILAGFGNILTTVGVNLTNQTNISISGSSSGISPSLVSSSSSSGMPPSLVSSSSSSGASSSGSALTSLINLNQQTKTGNGSQDKVLFNLSVEGGKLKGSIQIDNIISDGYIVSQNAISQDEVEITAKNKANKAVILKLKLFGKPSYIGIFLDGVLIDDRRLTPFYSYLVPKGSSVMAQPLSKPDTQINKPTKGGRPSGTGRPGGDSNGRAGGENSGRAGSDDSGRPGGHTDELNVIENRPGGDNGGRAGGNDDDSGRSGGND